MQKKMETTPVSWGYTGIMEKKMETTESGAWSELRVPQGPPIRIKAGHIVCIGLFPLSSSKVRNMGP